MTICEEPSLPLPWGRPLKCSRLHGTFNFHGYTPETACVISQDTLPVRFVDFETCTHYLMGNLHIAISLL